MSLIDSQVISDLKKENLSLKKEVAQLEIEVDSLDKMVKDLETENDDYEGQIEKLERTVDRLENQINELENGDILFDDQESYNGFDYRPKSELHRQCVEAFVDAIEKEGEFNVLQYLNRLNQGLVCAH